MRFYFLTLFIFFCSSSVVFPQGKTDSVFDLALSYRGLSREDITIPVNFDKEKSPRNDARLILPALKELMISPLDYDNFISGVSLLTDKSEKEILAYFLNILSKTDTEKFKRKTYQSISGNDLVKAALTIKNTSERLNGIFTKEEKSFLTENLLSLVLNTEETEGSSLDIFKYNIARDSSSAVSKKTLDILSRMNMDSVMSYSFNTFLTCLEIYNNIKSSGNIESTFTEESGIENNGLIFNYDKKGIRIAIGGYENNVYEGHFDFIIDFGGDDVYNISGSKDIFSNGFNCIMDLSGNDYYFSYSDYTIAGSAFSSGFIFDKSGDDVYKGKNISLGSAVGGIGFLCDEDGNDLYQSGVLSQAAASFGIGILFDKNGNDFYISNSYSQGFGMTQGAGAIIDIKGNDSYLCDSRSLDIGRYEDHFISMCQGFGLGMRPYYAGGIGLIIDGEGNDNYNTDIYGQGSAYWYGLGCISDKKGNDKYNSYQYAQGSGIHLAIGIIKDHDGRDFYTSKGVSQGCGHDLGVGILEDIQGNDNYASYSLSQGAGNANGIGIFLDKNGRDGYLNQEPGNTRGYGNPRRDYGSIGLFIDYSGRDFYSVPGKDSVISNTSVWGTMLDYTHTDKASVESSNSFKIPVDSSKDYSAEEYFIMAKTIEPRFSLWQEFGFRKLVNDSLKTAEYILKYLDTEDHRAALVLRNLAFKIGNTMGKVFTEKLKFHLVNMQTGQEFNEDQVSFICYLFGETGNPEGKEELLQLTFDEGIKVRTSSINALGKIKLQNADEDFKEKVSIRLRELAFSNTENKMLNKDIAFTFKNYMIKENIPALIHMLSNGYFGARFNSVECLKAMKDVYFEFIDENVLKTMSDNKTALTAFLNSLQNLPDEQFLKAYELFNQVILNAETEFSNNLREILQIKIFNSTDAEFIDRCEKIIESLNNKDLKIIK